MVQVVQNVQVVKEEETMQVKNFEDLEIWKDARALTRAIYQLTKRSKVFQGFRPCGIKSGGRQCRSCRTSPKDSNAAGIKSLFSFSMSPKPPAGKCARTFT